MGWRIRDRVIWIPDQPETQAEISRPTASGTEHGRHRRRLLRAEGPRLRARRRRGAPYPIKRKSNPHGSKRKLQEPRAAATTALGLACGGRDSETWKLLVKAARVWRTSSRPLLPWWDYLTIVVGSVLSLTWWAWNQQTNCGDWRGEESSDGGSFGHAHSPGVASAEAGDRVMDCGRTGPRSRTRFRQSAASRGSGCWSARRTMMD